MGKVIQVQVGHYRPVQYFDLNNIACNREDCVIIEGDRGSEFNYGESGR